MTQAEFSQGIDLPHRSAYDAYQSLLKGLLLQEFPCGLGEWREDFSLIQSELSRTRSKGTIKLPNLVDYSSSVTLKDVNPGAERTETLSELTRAKESPWCQTCDWTDEGARLRELAILEPWALGKGRVNSLLRTLKMQDKNVGEIDKKMRQLKSLEQLVLSANYLTWIDGQNLPASLRVLELHGNFLDDLAGLSPKPPPGLEHLGVGRNNLAFVGDHLSGIYWPNLLSLDLSFNHLCDLKGLLESLATLPKLRSLVLAGNPLALTPWYRGYTIDQLRKLLSLDDAKISADERHNYKGMMRRKEFVQEQCLLQIKVNTLKNLPVPPEIATPDEFPEYPVIVRKYYVRFWLPFEEDAATNGAGDGAQQLSGNELEASGDADLEGKGPLRKSTGFMSDIPEEPTDGDAGPNGPAAAGLARSQSAGGSPARRLVSGTVCSVLKSLDRAYAELTSPTDEAARDRIGWEGQAARSDLRVMRDFLLHDALAEIVEEKSLLYPPDQLPQEGGQEQHKDKQGQDKKKEEKKDDSKPKKKKKVDESSLVVFSTESAVLVSQSIDLSDLLSAPGQWVGIEVKSPSQAGSPTPTVPSTPANAEKRGKDGKEKAPAKEKKKEDKAKGGSAKPSGKKNPKDQTGSAEEGDQEAEKPQPPPVLAKVDIQRVQWRSVKDCPTAVVIAVDQS